MLFQPRTEQKFNPGLHVRGNQKIREGAKVMKFLKTTLIIIVCLFASFSITIAGSIQNSDGSPNFEPEEIVNFSKNIEKILAEREAAVAIVG